jgi:type IV secretory pathway VirB2 component (pilin)
MKKIKKILSAVSLCLAAAAPVSAQDVMPATMQTLMDKIVEIFKGPFVRGILVAALCGCAVAYGFNKDNEKMKRNIIAIAIAVAILITSTEIVKAVWTASGGTV